MFGRLISKYDFFRDQADRIGLRAALLMRAAHLYNRAARRVGWRSRWPVIRLRMPGCATPLYMRTGTTDYAVLQQIFRDPQYATVSGSPRVIFDCGAYAGYSALYFLNRFPDAFVVAVEPAADNLRMCRRNLAPYGDRVRVIHGALWNDCRQLQVNRGSYGDGGAWATQVLPAAVQGSEAETVQSFDVPALLEISGVPRVDLLKIDIERAEAKVFSGLDLGWLTSVNTIAIELHDAECEEIFFEALAHFDYELRRSGEVTICRNLRPKQDGTGRQSSDAGEPAARKWA